MTRLENWCTVYRDLYLPPELQKFSISGEIHNDENGRWDDGHRVTTSSIVKVDGRVVMTRSGSVYILGKPSDEFVKWCHDNGHHVPTEDEPIKVNNE